MKSNYLARQQQELAERMTAKFNAERDRLFTFALQYAQDSACIVLNREFGFGEDRVERFCLEFCKMLDTMTAIINTDCADDPDIVYAQAKIDEALKPAYGRNWHPWEVRYSAALNLKEIKGRNK